MKFGWATLAAALLLPFASQAAVVGPLSSTGDASSTVVTPTGGKTSRTLASQAADLRLARSYGAICDGTSHPLSATYATLAAAQVVFPQAVALTDETDLAAINSMLAAGSTVVLPATPGSQACVINGPILPATGSGIIGQGMGMSVIQAVAGPGSTYPNFALFNAGYPSTTVTNVTIKGVTFDGGFPANGTNVYPGNIRAGTSGILIGPTSTGNTFDQIEVRNSFWGFGFYGQQTMLTNSYIHDIWMNGIYVKGFALAQNNPRYAADITIRGNRFVHNSLYNYPTNLVVGSKLTATVSGGAVTGLAITTAGSGGTNGTYPVTFYSGGGGSGAAATYTVSGGVVTATTITAGGTGYTTAPGALTALLTGTGTAWYPEATGQPNIFGTFDGIDIDGVTQRITLDNNYIYGNDIFVQEAGQYVLGDGTDHFRTSWIYIRNNTIDSSPETGVGIDGAIDNVVVENTTIKDIQEASTYPTNTSSHSCFSADGPLTNIKVTNMTCAGVTSGFSVSQPIFVFNNGVYNGGDTTPPNGITMTNITLRDVTIPSDPFRANPYLKIDSLAANVLVNGMVILEDRGGGSGATYTVDTSGAAANNTVEVDGYTPFSGTIGIVHSAAGQILNAAGQTVGGSSTFAAIAAAPDTSNAPAALAALGGVGTGAVGGATVSQSRAGTAMSPWSRQLSDSIGRTVTPQDFGALCNGSYTYTFTQSVGAGTLGAGTGPAGAFGVTTRTSGVYANYAGGSNANLAFPALTAYSAQTGINFGMSPTDTQDWAATQAALAYLGSIGGGELYVPAGSNCQFNRQLLLPKNVAVHIRGAGNSMFTAVQRSNTTYTYVDYDLLVLAGNGDEVNGLTINGGGTWAPQNNGAIMTAPPIYAAVTASQTLTSDALVFPAGTALQNGMPISGPGVPVQTTGNTVPVVISCSVTGGTNNCSSTSVTLKRSGSTVSTTALVQTGASFAINDGYWLGFDTIPTTLQAIQNNTNGAITLLSSVFSNGSPNTGYQDASGNFIPIRPGMPIWASAPGTGVNYNVLDEEVACANPAVDGLPHTNSDGSCTGPIIYMQDLNGHIITPGVQDPFSGSPAIAIQMPNGTPIFLGGIQSLHTGEAVLILPSVANVSVHDNEIFGTTLMGVIAQGTNFTIRNNTIHDTWTPPINTFGSDTGGVLIQAGPGLITGNTVYRPARYGNGVLNGPTQPASARALPGGNGSRGVSFPKGFDGIGVNQETTQIAVTNNHVTGDDIILSDNCDAAEVTADTNAGLTCPGTGTVTNHMVSGNLINSDGDGVTVGGYVSSVHVTGNTIFGGMPPLRAGQVPACIGVYGAGIADQGLVIEGNHCQPSQAYAGIFVQGAATGAGNGGITIKGNVVQDVGSSSLGSGIEIHNVGSNVVLDGNVICDNRSPIGMLYAVDTNGALNGAAAGNPVAIRNNKACAGTSGKMLSAQSTDMISHPVGTGPVAQRPSAGNQGAMWLDPSTGVLTEDNGTSWVTSTSATSLGSIAAATDTSNRAGAVTNLGLPSATSLATAVTQAGAALPASGGAVTGTVTGLDTYASILANAGTVARVLGQQLGDVKNIKDYGAICDGTLHTLGATAPYSTMTSTQLFAAFPHVLEARLTSGKSVDWAAIQEGLSAGANGVASVYMSDRGTGGTPGGPYAIVFTGGNTGGTTSASGSGAAAGTYMIDSTGQISSITITAPSWGYFKLPTPTFPNGNIQGATAFVIPTTVRLHAAAGYCVTNLAVQVYSRTDFGGDGPGVTVIQKAALDATDGGGADPFSDYIGFRIGKYTAGSLKINADDASVHDMSIWGTGSNSFHPQYQTLTNGPISVPNSGGDQLISLNLDSAAGINSGDPVWEQTTNSIPPKTLVNAAPIGNTIIIDVKKNTGAFTIPANSLLTFRGLYSTILQDKGIDIDYTINRAHLFNLELAYQGIGMEFDGNYAHMNNVSIHHIWGPGAHGFGDWNTDPAGPVVTSTGNIISNSVCGPYVGLYHYYIQYGPGHQGVQYLRGVSNSNQLAAGYDCMTFDALSFQDISTNNVYEGPGSNDQIVTDLCDSTNEAPAVWAAGGNCTAGIMSSNGNKVVNNIFMNGDNAAINIQTFAMNTLIQGNIIVGSSSNTSNSYCQINVTTQTTDSHTIIADNTITDPQNAQNCAITMNDIPNIPPWGGGVTFRNNTVSGYGLSGQGAPVTLLDHGQNVRWIGGRIVDPRAGGIASVTMTNNGTGGTDGTYFATFTGGGQFCNPTVAFTVTGGSVVPSSVQTQVPSYGCTAVPTISFASAPGLTSAAATITLFKGGVSSLNLTNAGTGGTNATGYLLGFTGGTNCNPTGTYNIVSNHVDPTSIVITNGGSECAFPPTVTFPNGGVTGAAGTAALALYTSSVGSVTVTANGTGGTNGTNYALGFSGGSNCLPTGTYKIVGGVVTAPTITYPGYGCTSAPTVSFPQGGISGAAATATVESANGEYALDVSGLGPNVSIQNGDFQAYSTGAVNMGAGQTRNTDDTAWAALTSPALTGTPTVPTAAASTNTTQAASTAMVQAAITANSPVTSVNTVTGGVVTDHCDLFTATGTWTKLSWAASVTGDMVGAGGGGGMGGTDPGSTLTSGGASGAAGSHVTFSATAASLGATVTATIGTGGTGSTGSNSNAGGSTHFNGLFAYGGGGGGDGAPGVAAGAGAGPGLAGNGASGSGATPGSGNSGGQSGTTGIPASLWTLGQGGAGSGDSASCTAGTNGSNTNNAPGAGGAGGCLSAAATPVAGAGGNGGSPNGGTNATGGANTGAVGGAGTTLNGLLGTGGAGGGANPAGAGGAGGAGGLYGGGGGAGGAGTTAGGVGGAGGNGAALICQHAAG